MHSTVAVVRINGNNARQMHKRSNAAGTLQRGKPLILIADLASYCFVVAVLLKLNPRNLCGYGLFLWLLY